MQISLKTQDKPNKIGVTDNYCGFVFPVSLFILLRKKNRNARSEGAHSTVIPAHLQFQHSAGYGQEDSEFSRARMAHAFNPSTWELEAGGSL